MIVITVLVFLVAVCFFGLCLGVSHFLDFQNFYHVKNLIFFMKVLLGTLVLFPLSWTQWIYLNITKGYKNLGTNENARYWLVKHHPGGLICAVRFFLVSSIHKRILETHKKESFEHTHTHTHITDTCTSYSLIFCVCYEYYGYS